MISAFFKALSDLGDPRMRSVLWQSIGLSLVTAILLWSGLTWLLSSTELIGDVPFVGGWLETAVDWLGSIAVFALVILLLPAFLGIYAGFYIETICRAVEARHYPHLATARNQSIMEAVVTGLKFGVLLIVFNLFLLIFIFFPPIYFVLGWVVNGHLLGREYLEMVGFRRMSPRQLHGYRHKKRGPIFMSGLMLAVIASIPVVNLILPLFGTAMMLHIFEETRELESVNIIV
ncbi:MAG: EI24 domain-containing protein [Proteobacteria bacterium]|nr:EI24 domain-containing protein [Pseudomonadota bacterium]